jgi:8-oxo-dGTP pyrophosphatase MutT (NUDIX family)
VTPVEPKPAASVLLLRPAPSGGAHPIEVYVIRRNKGMKFLGGYYAFPGGRVDAADGSAVSVQACHGLGAGEAEAIFPGDDRPAIAYWVTAVRELLEETGLLLACDSSGRPVDVASPAVASIVEALRKRLMAGEPFAELLAGQGWRCDLRGLKYLSHFITPRKSPIRFSARFFLCPLPEGQAPRLFTEETSEGFWIGPAEAYRRFIANEMAMAEPAEYGLGYLAQFASLDEVWSAHADGRHKFHGIVDRIDAFWEGFDWKTNRWPDRSPTPRG